MRIILTITFHLLVVLTGPCLHAQQKVTVIVDQFPSYHKPGDTIYIAGSFNNWNPRSASFALQNRDGRSLITLDLPRGSYEFKFTKGSWDQVETSEDGNSISNRKLVVENDMTLTATVSGWAGHFPRKEKQHTASRNVSILDTAFFIPQLGRHRRIWIYLPEDYARSKKKYPVLYMQDGQNLFDEFTSGYGEWGVDEALDSLRENTRQLIVVGIDHGGEKRLNEYAPFDMERYGKGEGDHYLDFLVKNLKPFIDRKYRTKKNRKHTFIAGSSMGGLISCYALIKFPKVFGGAGIFSPAFWINPAIKDIPEKRLKKIKGRIYFMAGQQESARMVPDMLLVFERLRLYSKARIMTVVRAEAKHNEASWRKEFPLFYNWILPRKGDR